MARIRSIHPGLFTDEAFMSLSLLARVVLPGLWTECDDQGVFAWKTQTLKARLLPGDNADMAAVLAELEAADFIRAFSHGGRPFGAMRNFRKYQRPKRPSHVHTLPAELRAYVGLSDDMSPPLPHLFSHAAETPAQREEGEEEEGEEIKHTVRDGDAGFEEFWKSFDPPKNARKPEARRAWAATAELRPPLRELLGAVAGYRAWVAEQSRKQKRDYPMQHPATWLRGEVWNGFLATAPPDEDAAAHAWEGRAAPLVAEIGAAQFAAWFSGARFSPGEAPLEAARFTVPGEFKRKWIVEHFGATLERCYGAHVVEAV
jgi:hypothetical protein